jgi:hypothetical protein
VGRRPSSPLGAGGWSYPLFERRTDRRKLWTKQEMSVSPSSLYGPSTTPFR